MSPRKTLSQQGRPSGQTQNVSMVYSVKEAANRVSPSAPAVAQLRALRLLREQVTRAERAALKQARADGGSWSELGHALGMSPQGAFQRAQ